MKSSFAAELSFITIVLVFASNCTNLPTGVSNTLPASAVASVISGAPLNEIVVVFDDDTSTTSNLLLAFCNVNLVPAANPDKSSPVPATIVLLAFSKVTFEAITFELAYSAMNTSSPSVNDPLIPFEFGVKNSKSSFCNSTAELKLLKYAARKVNLASSSE